MASDTKYTSSYSGFIGLAPFVEGTVSPVGDIAGSRERKDNFMA